MSLDSDRLVNLAKTLEDDEAEIVLEWIVDGIKEVGMEHNDMCALFRPHSHSADCDCGRDELQKKILRILAGVG
jgi:hypothetical protein